jgi:hypothetical protein
MLVRTLREHEGLQVKAFPEYIVHHHKSCASASGLVSESLREGAMDNAVASHSG